MFSLNVRDLIKGVATSVFVAVIFALYTLTQQPGFDIFAVDWGTTLHTIANLGLITFIGYIGKNFVSTPDGKVFGRI